MHLTLEKRIQSAMDTDTRKDLLTLSARIAHTKELIGQLRESLDRDLASRTILLAGVEGRHRAATDQLLEELSQETGFEEAEAVQLAGTLDGPVQDPPQCRCAMPGGMFHPRPLPRREMQTTDEAFEANG